MSIDHLIHACKRGSEPFRSLSALPDEEAVQVMRSLYMPGSIFWERFQDPMDYLQTRREVEAWLRRDFALKGGVMRDACPVYMVFGRSRWLQTMLDGITLSTTFELLIPLSLFQENEISFTYPDSMVSWLLARQQPPGLYLPDYHGKVFTLPEMRAIVEAHGLPGERWGSALPDSMPNYIEAQVWNRLPLLAFWERNRQQLDLHALNALGSKPHPQP